MRKVKIKKTPIPTRKEATEVRITILSFPLYQKEVPVYYQLIAADNTVQLDGNLIIPEAVVKKWKDDDKVIVDEVARQLSLTVTQIEG